MPKLSRNLVSLFFPARCLACEKEISPYEHEALATTPEDSSAATSFDFLQVFDQHWCPDCWENITSDVGKENCYQCGAAITGHNPFEDCCALCRDLDLRFEQTITVGNYRGLLQSLIVRLKNQHDEQLAIQLGYVLGNQIRQSEFYDEINLILPIPTHWWTRFRRGFSGAEILAGAIARSCDLPVSLRVLQSLRTTQKQGTLSTAGRFKNIRKAFGILPGTNVDGLTILLVDDVMTSGATISEVAQALLKAGATKVYAGVIARGARVS